MWKQCSAQATLFQVWLKWPSFHIWHSNEASEAVDVWEPARYLFRDNLDKELRHDGCSPAAGTSPNCWYAAKYRRGKRNLSRRQLFKVQSLLARRGVTFQSEANPTNDD